jgi:hypothetical protein
MKTLAWIVIPKVSGVTYATTIAPSERVRELAHVFPLIAGSVVDEARIDHLQTMLEKMLAARSTIQTR